MCVWICTIVEVEDMLPGFVMKYRSLPFGKGDGGMGLNDFDASICIS